jgi:hypothetical protein
VLDLAADAQIVRDTMTDYDELPSFMPVIQERGRLRRRK